MCTTVLTRKFILVPVRFLHLGVNHYCLFSWFWTWSNLCLTIWALPISSIILLDLNMGQSSRVHTPKCYCNTIWIRTWNIEWSDATNLTECVLCRMSAKGVSCKKLIGICLKLKHFRRDNEMNIGSHGAVRTIALPGYNTIWCSDCPSYFSTVASTAVYYHVMIHSSVLYQIFSSIEQLTNAHIMLWIEAMILKTSHIIYHTYWETEQIQK